MIVALGLPLKVAAIIRGCIFSMLFSVFNALGPISNPTPPTAALTEFFLVDTVTSDHPLPVSWYLISLVCVYLCSCMHIMSILCSSADAISSGSCPILFKVLTLNVAICSVCLHFSSFDRLLFVYTLVASVNIRNHYNKNTRKTPDESFTGSKTKLK